MLNERKCPACGRWTDSNQTHCTHCGALSDPDLIAEKNRMANDKLRKANELANESKAFKKIRELQTSKNPFLKAIFFIGNIFFTIYMAILSFIVWIIALISG